MNGGRDLLVASLNAQRQHVLGILDGLSDQDLRRPMLPSGWSCLGMVRHLALDVERFWFRAVVAGESVELENGDGAWRVDPDEPAAAVLDLYRREAARADAIVSPGRWTVRRRGLPRSCSAAGGPRTCRRRCCT